MWMCVGGGLVAGIRSGYIYHFSALFSRGNESIQIMFLNQRLRLRLTCSVIGSKNEGSD